METQQIKQIDAILEDIKKQNRKTLLEHEVYGLFQVLKIKTPVFEFCSKFDDINENILSKFPADKVVVKIVSPQIFHKTDIGGVLFLEKNVGEIKNAWKKFSEICDKQEAVFTGLLITELINYQPGLFGREILFSVRWSENFGHLLTLGIGGVETELFGKVLKEEHNVFNELVFDITKDELKEKLKENLVYKKISGQTRGGKILLSDENFFGPLWKLIELAKHYGPLGKGNLLLQEMEINPFIVHQDNLIPLDAIVRISDLPPVRREANVEKIAKLLKPESIGIVGVSGKAMNMGRIILNNIINSNFKKENIYVVKENEDKIDGCVCVPEISDLSCKLDLFIIAVNAAQTPKIIEQLLKHNACESVIIIPGGMGEKGEEGKKIEANIKEMIQKMDDPPVMVGGNCLGISSTPGKYDTFFIPDYKMKKDKSLPGKLVFISQSGAFIITKMSKLGVHFHYAVSTGNQIDLTTTDYLSYFTKYEKDIETLAFYVEGFNYLDGLAFVQDVKKAIADNKKVIFYKAGKTSKGQSAAMGHTASIAGEYDVCARVMKSSGVYWTDSFKEFEDCMKLFSCFSRLEVKGNNLGLISNAGFETVGMADNVHNKIVIPSLKDETVEQIKEVYQKGRLDEIANISNPLDITPVANDWVYEQCSKIFMQSDYIDAIIVSIVPLSPANNTLAKDTVHKEDISYDDSLPSRLIRLYKACKKPMVAVIDSGENYEPLARMLQDANIPVFRNADWASKLMSGYMNYRLKKQ